MDNTMQTFQHLAPHAAGTYRHRITIAPNLAVALVYSRAGIPVFPCAASGPRRKQPLTPRGHHDATTDLDTIGGWWTRWPDALVGIPTGPDSGVWIFDIDGPAGRCSLNELMARLGVETIADLTPCVSRTPSGGLHLIFRLQPGERPRNRARDIGAGFSHERAAGLRKPRRECAGGQWWLLRKSDGYRHHVLTCPTSRDADDA